MTASTRVRQTQEERVAESSRRLLEAAIELISEKGYERTTAAEISERAGYSRPMVRTRYGSKEGLLESILRTEYDARLFGLSADEQPQSGLDQVLAQLSRLSEIGEQEPRLMRSFLVLSFETVGPVRELRPWMQSLLSRYTSGLEQALRLGQEDGSVDAEIDPALEAEHIIADGIGRAFLALVASDADAFVARMLAWRDSVERRLRPRRRGKR